MEQTASAAKRKTEGSAKKRIKTIITIAVIAAVVAGVIFLLWRFVFREEPKEILRDTAVIGTISNQVQGYGYTKALDSATITLATGGKVLDVYVAEGDLVQQGDPLYQIDSTSARDSLESAQKTLLNVNKQIRAITDSYANLTIKPPFTGKILNAEELTVGQTVSAGTKIATIVDDSVMKLKLYFSYAYENDIYAGQAADVSIPVSMSRLSGKVESIDKVRFVTPEGTVCFQVTISVANPGTLTEGMQASAVLKNAQGEDIYAYNGGTLAFSRKEDIVTKASGDVLSVHLLNYETVTPNTVLLKLSEADNEEELASLENQRKAAEEAVEKAQKNLDNFNAVAPISGTVLTCALTPGDTVSDGTTVIVIADTTTMLVTVDVDERSIGYVSVGMPIDLTDWDGNTYVGEVTNVSLNGKMENGAATFPITIRVDNENGALKSNMTINYSFQASQAENCLIVPVQAVKNISDETGEPITVVFVELPERPENAVSVPEGLSGVPTEADGFYAVPVEVGISDVYNVQILSGLNEGDTVFTSYMEQQEDSEYGIYG